MVELDLGDAPCSSAEQMDSNLAPPAGGSRPERPDRQAFQESLREFNEQIAELSYEIDEICGGNGHLGKLKDLKSLCSSLHERRRELKQEVDAHRPRITKLREQLQDKDRVVSDLENDLMYKREEPLKARLRSLEDTYNKKLFTSFRDEQALIKDIDKLKRNLTKLTKYNCEIVERDEIKRILQQANAAQSKAYKSIRQLSHELQQVRDEIGSLKKSVNERIEIRKELNEDKKKLVDEYNRIRQDYMLWKKRNTNPDTSINMGLLGPVDKSYPATFPAAKRARHEDRLEDEEELEPFFEQKRDCNRLIAYLESLESQLEPSERSSTDLSQGSITRSRLSREDSEDSAEELPPSFLTLKKHTSLPMRTSIDSQLEQRRDETFLGKVKRKANTKSAKKPNQSISHGFELVKLFLEVEVDLPLSYNKVPAALDELREKVDFFEQQTNFVVWEDSDYQNLGQMTESQYTGTFDSVLNGSTDVSDRGSTTGRGAMPTSPQTVIYQAGYWEQTGTGLNLGSLSGSQHSGTFDIPLPTSPQTGISFREPSRTFKTFTRFSSCEWKVYNSSTGLNQPISTTWDPNVFHAESGSSEGFVGQGPEIITSPPGNSDVITENFDDVITVNRDDVTTENCDDVITVNRDDVITENCDDIIDRLEELPLSDEGIESKESTR